jgi:hypothetical protein
VRKYWIFVPAQYKPSEAASVLVFQDGQRATNPEGSLRVPTVLENLIHEKAIPVTIGIFITPGNTGEIYPDNLGMKNPDHRAQEYDALNDSYARFLIEEMLPAVGARYRLSADPEQHAIGGTSSGAICAFTVAWQRPDMFRKVVSIIGSYTSIGYKPATGSTPLTPGGDLYPGMIRKSPIRPMKIFLQDGSNDLNNEHGNWFLANQQMLSALEWANAEADRQKKPGPRYAINHVWGDGALCRCIILGWSSSTDGTSCDGSSAREAPARAGPSCCGAGGGWARRGSSWNGDERRACIGSPTPPRRPSSCATSPRRSRANCPALPTAKRPAAARRT